MVGSNLWLTPVMAVAFVAALAGFQKMPAGLAADAAAAGYTVVSMFPVAAMCIAVILIWPHL